MVEMTFYGGVDEIGGTKILLEDNDTKICLDFGMSFVQRGKYTRAQICTKGHETVGEDVKRVYRVILDSES
jgi:ribonuclease J